MQIISVMNYKGGVGKTTVTANLAAGLAAYKGKKVLLLDMDSQASLTFSFIKAEYWYKNLKENKTIKNWFDCISDSRPEIPLSDLITNRRTFNKGGVLDIISSHLGLINVDLELAALLSGITMTQSKKNYIKVHGKLRSAIQTIGKEYDLVLIDCPPNFNIVTKNALIASDKILIPAKPDYLSTMGIDYLIKSIEKLKNEFNEYADLDTDTNPIDPKFIGIVFTMIQFYSDIPIKAQRQYISQIKLNPKIPIPVMDSMFRESKSIFAAAPENGSPVVLSSNSYIVTEIEHFIDEFIKLTEV